MFAWLKGELDAGDGQGYWALRAAFYDSGGAVIGSDQVAALGGEGTLSPTWQLQGGRMRAPANAAMNRVYPDRKSLYICSHNLGII